MKQVMLLAGAGQIGMAIARRMGAGMKIVVGDKKIGNAQAIARTMNEAGFDVVPMEMDLSSQESIKALIAEGQKYGPIQMLVNAATKNGSWPRLWNGASGVRGLTTSPPVSLSHRWPWTSSMAPGRFLQEYVRQVPRRPSRHSRRSRQRGRTPHERQGRFHQRFHLPDRWRRHGQLLLRPPEAGDVIRKTFHKTKQHRQILGIQRSEPANQAISDNTGNQKHIHRL